MPTNDVYCAITGVLPDDGDYVAEHPLEDEDLSELPVGWTRVTVQTRTPSPAWQEIVGVEEAMVAQVLDGVPKGQRKAATVGVRVQVAAQLAALKAQTAPYVIDTDVFYIAPGEDGAKGLTALRAVFGNDAAAADEAAGDDGAAEPEAGNDE
jgi:hypothetical protein